MQRAYWTGSITFLFTCTYGYSIYSYLYVDRFGSVHFGLVSFFLLCFRWLYCYRAVHHRRVELRDSGNGNGNVYFTLLVLYGELLCCIPTRNMSFVLSLHTVSSSPSFSAPGEKAREQVQRDMSIT